IKALLLFAVGKTSAALWAQAFGLADFGGSAGANKAMLLGAAAVLLNLVGMVVGLGGSARPAESPDPATEPSGAGRDFTILERPGRRSATSVRARVRPSV